MAQSRIGHRKNGLGVATVVLLAMGAGHQAGAGETALGERSANGATRGKRTA